MKSKIFVLLSIIFVFILSSAAWGKAEIPEEIKKAAPPYPNAQVREVMKTPRGIGVILTSLADTPQVVADFYKKEMIDRGWILEAEKDLGGKINILLVKGDDIFQITIYGRNNQGASFVLFLKKKGKPEKE